MAWQKKVKKAVFGATSKSEYSFRGGSPHVHVVEQTKNVLLAADGMGGTVEESLKHAVHGLPRLPWPDGRQYVELPQDHPRRNLAEVRGTLTKWRQILVWKVMSMATWFLFSNVPNFFGDLKNHLFYRWSWCQFFGAHVASRCICFLHWMTMPQLSENAVFFNMPSMWSSSGNCSSLLLFAHFLATIL